MDLVDSIDTNVDIDSAFARLNSIYESTPNVEKSIQLLFGKCSAKSGEGLMESFYELLCIAKERKKSDGVYLIRDGQVFETNGIEVESKDSSESEWRCLIQ